MPQIPLEEIVSAYAPEIYAAALLGRFPLYRNWNQPFRDLCRATRFGGLSALFLRDEPLEEGCLLETDLDALEMEPLLDPVGWFAHIQGENDILFTPVYRLIDLTGAEPPVFPVADPKQQPKLEPETFIMRLGYRLQIGQAWCVEERLITYPHYLSSVDRTPFLFQILCQNEWAKRGYSGHLGAAFLLAILACELGLDLSQLELTAELRDELLRLKPDHFFEQAVDAVTLAGELLSETYGDAAHYRYCERLSGPQPITLEKGQVAPNPTLNIIQAVS